MAEDLAITITPSYSDEDIKVTERKIDTFYGRINKEHYDVIVKETNGLIKNTLGKDMLLNFTKNICKNLEDLFRSKIRNEISLWAYL